MIIAASPMAAETAPFPGQAQAHAARAYGAVRAARSLRAQESEVFSILAGRLRAAQRAGEGLAATRAAADARRVFTALDTLVVHPSSPLPRELRMTIATVARRAIRETEEASPDLDFLASVAEDFAVGLSHERGSAA
jgi:flagellar biosynthesis regulator FlaF